MRIPGLPDWLSLWVGLCYPLFVVWKLFRIFRNYGSAGAVLLDLEHSRFDRRFSWGFAAVVGTIYVELFVSRWVNGDPRTLFQDIVRLLAPLAFTLYPTGTSLVLGRTLCERGILWGGQLIPWESVAGWKDTPRHGLQIDVKQPTWFGSETVLLVSLEDSHRAAEILAQHASETSRLVQHSLP